MKAKDSIMVYLRSVNFGMAKMMYRLIKPLGISPAQGRLLMELNERGGSATVGALAAGMETPCSNVSNICARLQARAFVEKSREQSDMRSVKISLTEKGGAELKALKGDYENMMSRLTESMSEEETESVAAALCKLSGAVRRALKLYPAKQGE